jgi:putative sigma-54 modulation protein
MNLTISGHHLEVTPALRSYVTTKLDRITRHFDQVVDVKVLLTVEKQKEKERRQRAECTIHVKGNDMFAESAHEDLYAITTPRPSGSCKEAFFRANNRPPRAVFFKVHNSAAS